MFRTTVSLLAALAMISPAVIGAQSGSAASSASEADRFTLTGVVTDPVGGVLPAVVVTATNRESGAAASARTDSRGRYRLELGAGRYRVEATSGYFDPAAREIAVEGDEVLDLELDLARFLHSVHVIESSPSELLRVPGGIADVGPEDLEEITYGNVEEALAFQPGVMARSRFGADEVQFSVRGSGLRNNFHMRGINLLFNGRPYMDADGFGDFESLDLMATQRIEVWKGANALRFGGNQAGGAINFVTPTGETAPQLRLRGLGGSFGLMKGQLASGGTSGPFSYYASLGLADTDGYRDYAAQERRRLFSNLGWQLSDATDLRVDLVYANVDEELPGALTREEFDRDPRQANAENVRQGYGRDYDFYHAAFAVDHRLDDRNVLAVSVHGHVRDVIHPIFQVLDQYQVSYGADFAYRHSGERSRLLIGFAPLGGGNEEERFENLEGERGAMTASFETDIRSLGLYGEYQYDLSRRMTLVAGGRFDSSERQFDDLFLADGDRSDSRTFEAFSPKLGAVWAPRPGLQIFGNVSRSYEPPLLLELTSFGDDVGFIDLDAQDTWQYEIGTRGSSARGSWEVSLFDWEVEDEIVNINVQPFPFAPFTIPSYRNAEKTRHLGLEAGGRVRLGAFSLRGAYTWSEFTYVDDPDFGDNDLPGAPEHVLYAELRWEHPQSSFWVAPNVDANLGDYYVDSANTTRNESFTVVGLKAGYSFGELDLFLDADNLTDEDYSGSVQVDNALGRYLEPGNGRSVFVGVGWRHE